jgi:hypothetical protein
VLERLRRPTHRECRSLDDRELGAPYGSHRRTNTTTTTAAARSATDFCATRRAPDASASSRRGSARGLAQAWSGSAFPHPDVRPTE